MKRSSPVLAGIAATVFVFALVGPAAAINTLQTRADARVQSSSSGAFIAHELDTSAPGGNVSVSSSGATYDASASTFVDGSNYGELRISGNAASTGSGVNVGSFSFIDIRDSLTLSNLALSGQAGILTVSLFAVGSLEASNNGQSLAQSRWALNILQGGGPFLFLHEVREFDLNAGPPISQCFTAGALTPQCYGLFTFDLPFTFGTTFDLFLRLDGSAQAGTNAAGNVAYTEYDLGSSIYWGGFSNVRSGGLAVTNYDFTSESGFDWRESNIPASVVPEPATLALLGLGLAGLGFSRRKQ